MAFYDSIWWYCLDNGRSTGSHIIFYQGGPIYHRTHVPIPVPPSSAQSEYNASCTTEMDSAHFRVLIHELLKRDTDIFLEEYPIIILDSKYAVCMANNGNYTKHTRHVSRRLYLLRNGGKWKMHKVFWCEEGLYLADIATKNVGEKYLNTRMKYIIGRLYN